MSDTPPTPAPAPTPVAAAAAPVVTTQAPPSTAPEVAPSEIAGGEVLDREASVDSDDGPPMLEVRGRQFKLRSTVPGMLLSKVSRVGANASKLAKLQLRPDQMTERQIEQMTEASAATYDTFHGLVDPADRDALIDWMIDCEPPIEFDELSDLMATAMEKITGRPTQPSPSSA